MSAEVARTPSDARREARGLPYMNGAAFGGAQ
jgi:hypothetical protein